jgi:hypothetical protein
MNCEGEYPVQPPEGSSSFHGECAKHHFRVGTRAAAIESELLRDFTKVVALPVVRRGELAARRHHGLPASGGQIQNAKPSMAKGHLIVSAGSLRIGPPVTE